MLDVIKKMDLKTNFNEKEVTVKIKVDIPSTYYHKYRCKFPYCSRKRRDRASNRCIHHGGGKKCKFPGCKTAVHFLSIGKGQYCTRHGGGYRCKISGCNSRAMNRIDLLCSMHTDRINCYFPHCKNRASTYYKDIPVCGRHSPTNSFPICKKTTKYNKERYEFYKIKCNYPDCKRVVSRGGWGVKKYCISHGGGGRYRCSIPNCVHAAIPPIFPQKLCIHHGGGHTCVYPGCDKKHSHLISQKIRLCADHAPPEMKCVGTPKCRFRAGYSKNGKVLCDKHGYEGPRCLSYGCNHPVYNNTDNCLIHTNFESDIMSIMELTESDFKELENIFN